MKYRAVLFDYDFTIADSEMAIFVCYNKTICCFGYPEASADEIKYLSGKPAIEILSALTALNADSPVLVDMLEAFQDYADQYMTENTTLYNDVPTMIEELASNGILLGIVSNKSSKRIEEVLRRDNLLKHFSIVVGEPSMPKPDASGIFTAIKTLGVNLCECVYVGDSLIDAQTAKNAGIDFIPVLTGATKQNEFDKYKYVTAIPNLSQLNSFLLDWKYDKYLKHLDTKLDDYDLFSFDVFDTLLFRRCEKPVDVFSKVWEETSNQQGNLTLTNAEYVELRRLAERKAVKKHYPKHSFEFIFEEMKFDKDTIDFLKMTEIDLEKQTVYLNKSIYSLINYLYSIHKRIVLVSDMYHSEHTIKELLICAGVDLELISKVFVSSEYDCRKGNGELFDKVIDYFNIDDRRRVVHIGDNEIGDYLGAKIAGLDAVLYVEPSGSKSDETTKRLICICEEIKAKGLKNVAIFTAGNYGRLFLKIARNRGLEIKCFIDNNSMLWGKEVDNVMVSALKSVSCDCIVVATTYAEEIKAQLEQFYSTVVLKPEIYYFDGGTL